MNVRLMKIEDLEAVYEISCKCFSIPWSMDSISREINNPVAYYIVAETDDNIIVGYGGLWCILDEGEIINIAVSDAYRKQGIGALLLAQLKAYAKNKEMHSITLEVRASNVAAQKLYLSQNFKEIAKRKAYYKLPTEDAMIMQCLL